MHAAAQPQIESPAELVGRARTQRLLFDIPGYEEAVPLLKQAIELDPAFGEAYAELAQVYAYWGFRREITGEEHQSLYGMALEFAEQALRLAPRHASAHRAAAVALRRGARADPERRAREVDEALRLAPEDPETLCEKWRVDGYDPDSPLLRKVLELSPGLVSAHIDRGAALSELERYPEALAELEKAVALNPANAQAYYDIAMTLDRMGLGAKAERLLAKARLLRPDDALLAQGQAALGGS